MPLFASSRSRIAFADNSSQRIQLGLLLFKKLPLLFQLLYLFLYQFLLFLDRVQQNYRNTIVFHALYTLLGVSNQQRFDLFDVFSNKPEIPSATFLPFESHRMESRDQLET